MGWSPWAEVGGLPHVQVRHVDLPDEVGGGALVRRGPTVWILLDQDLPQDERRAVLAHELEHLRRGPSSRCVDMPSGWDDVIAREEISVDRAVARRLVPLDELAVFVDRVIELGEPVGAAAVMEEFGVPVDVAHLALHLLAQARRLAG